MKYAQIAGLCVLVGVLASACSTSMTYMTTPQTLEPGQMQASVAMQGDANTNVVSTFSDALDVAKQRIKNSNEQSSKLTEEQYRTAVDAALAGMLFKPGIATELAFRVGVADGLDAGIRYNGASVKADVKARIWQTPDKKSVLSILAGVGQQTIDLPKPVEYLTLTNFSRTDADVALMFGSQPSSFLRAYIGPRMIYSWIKAEPVIDQSLLDVAPDKYAKMDPSQYFGDETILYLGGTGGLMAGYKWIWVTVEATVMYMDFTPKVLGQRRDLSGVQISPVAGLMVEF